MVVRTRVVPLVLVGVLLGLLLAPTTQANPPAAGVREVRVDPVPGGAVVSWQPPAFGGPVMYHVYRLYEAGWRLFAVTHDTQVFDATVSALNGFVYGYNIVAVNALGERTPSIVVGIAAPLATAPGPNCVAVIVQFTPAPYVGVNGTCLLRTVASLVPDPGSGHLVETLLIAIWNELPRRLPLSSEAPQG